MTPEIESAIRAQGRKCVDEIRQAKAEMEFSGAADPQKASRKDRAYGRQPCGIR